jgi:cell wall-active antibiotic response 4TMS protein YvqF
MARMRRRGGTRQTTAGLLLMAAGVLLLLDQQGAIEIGSVWRWWPLLPVVFGIWKITAPPESRDIAHGAELIIFGAWLLACTRHYLGLSFANSWPLVFVGMGVRLIIKSLIGPSAPEAVKENGHA